MRLPPFYSITLLKIIDPFSWLNDPQILFGIHVPITLLTPKVSLMLIALLRLNLGRLLKHLLGWKDNEISKE